MRDAVDRVPFSSVSQLVEFIVFEERLTNLVRAFDAIEHGLDRYMFDLRQSVAEHSNRRDIDTDVFDDSGELVGTSYGAEIAEHAEEQLAWAEELVPTFSFGGIFALIFSTFELLLSDLCNAVAPRCSIPFAEFAGALRAPLAERRLEYLVREGVVAYDYRQGDWPTFEKLRQLRNRFVHSLGEDVSEQLKGDVDEILGGGSTRGVIDGAVVRKAIEVVASVAQRLDAAYTTS